MPPISLIFTYRWEAVRFLTASFQSKTNRPPRTKTVDVAGRVGFEPTVEHKPDNHLAGGPNRPLWHLPVFNEQLAIIN